MGRILAETIRQAQACCQKLIPPTALLGVWAAAAILSAADPATDLSPYEMVNAAPAFRPISELHADIRLTGGRVPVDQAQGLFSAPTPVDREALNRSAWPELGFWWAPTELFHQPLYFDDLPLERYGQTRCRSLQAGISGVHFFGSAALLPYKLLVDDPCRPVSPLGYYRPGDCAPPQRETLRLGVDPNWLNPCACLWRYSADAAH